MKKLLTTVIAMAVIGFMASCEQSDDRVYDEATPLKYQASQMRTLGLNLVFTGNYEFPTHGAECAEGTFPVRNAGAGTGTHFKKLTSVFEFCVRPTGPGSGSYPEGYINAYFEDENGDRLFIEVAGEVFAGRVPGMPNYAISYFKDPFVILGGTGKFEGASGEGVTNDYNFINKDGIQQTSHHWQGTITMKKGKN
ncbi:hypothetical protein [Robiginitalea sp. IMCC43444]|uniref:hypothetical protein n=1 Tax=Robiginitalea sp. IMCC43444 TaxID=3459121 RepID=UPI004043936F